MMRRSVREDRGLTMTELIIAMGIFGILMAIVFSIMIMLTYQAKDSLARAESVEQARLGISHIDRQVRSGNLIANPANETFANSGVAPYFSLRIYTQEDGNDQCVQWRVIDHDGDGFHDLEFRSWEPSDATDHTDWAVVAHNIVVPDAIDTTAPTGESWPPFFVDNANVGQSESQFVRITLRLLEPDASPGAKPSTVTTVVTGRNTVFGYPTSTCSNVPSPD